MPFVLFLHALTELLEQLLKGRLVEVIRTVGVKRIMWITELIEPLRSWSLQFGNLIGDASELS